MKCEYAELYLLDYLQNQLGWWHRHKVDKHLQQCPECRAWLDRFRSVVDILHGDTLPEPGTGTWRQIRHHVEQVATTIAVPGGQRRTFRRPWWQYAAAMTIVLMSAFLGWLILPGKTVVKEGNCSLFWSFFNSDMWDFSNFFDKMKNKKLMQITPRVEEVVQIRLEQELDLDKQNSSRLFSLLRTFGYKMKEYYGHYCVAMSDLAHAMENGEQTMLEKCLEEIQQIRQKWSESRGQFLASVRFLLNPKQFARFLMFTERLPQELYAICAQVLKEQS
jgi:hypothetical protein